MKRFMNDGDRSAISVKGALAMGGDFEDLLDATGCGARIWKGGFPHVTT